MTKLTIASLVAVVFISVAYSVADTPTLDEMDEGVKKRIRTYSGLEFSLTSSFYEYDDGKEIYTLPALRETIRLYFPEKGPPWKYWVQEIQDKFDDEWIINSFLVTNIVETREFDYKPDESRCDASINRWYSWSKDDGRIFFDFLGMCTVGMSFLSGVDYFSDEMIQRGRGMLEFAKEGEFAGKKIYIFQGKWEDGTIIEIHFLASPFLLVYYNANDFTEEDKWSKIYQVDEVGFFDEIAYPKKGSFHQSSIRYMNKVDYEFEVTDVKRLGPEYVENWFPEWPPNTDAFDNATGEFVAKTPPTERQIKKIAETRWQNLPPIQSKTWINVLMMTTGILLIIASLSLMIWKQYKK